MIKLPKKLGSIQEMQEAEKQNEHKIPEVETDIIDV